MRTVNPERQQAKRQEILRAATACFVRKGFHRTSTAEICAEAGMSPGNLFHYFASKQAIIAAIVDQEGEDTVTYFAGIDEANDLFAELVAFFDTVLGLAADPSYATLALEIAAEAMRDDDIAQRVARNDAAIQNALRDLLTEAAARGQIDATLDAAATATWIGALIDGLFNRVAVDPGFEPLSHGKMARLILTRILRPPAR